MATTIADYVSVWDGVEISTPCVYDASLARVSEIEFAEDDGSLNVVEREFILLPDGSEIVTFFNADAGIQVVDGHATEDDEDS